MKQKRNRVTKNNKKVSSSNIKDVSTFKNKEPEKDRSEIFEEVDLSIRDLDKASEIDKYEPTEAEYQSDSNNMVEEVEEKPKEVPKKHKDKPKKSKDVTKFPRLKKILMAIWYVVRFLIVLPLRVFEVLFDIIYHSLNLIFLVVILLALLGTYMFSDIYPMYQEAADTAYTSLANIKDTDFRKLSDTEVYDKDGELIGTINAGHYQYVDITDVSEYVQYGYIATEDKRFMEHCGVDFQSLVRAGLSLVRNGGEITQGGSTITQQVVKNNVINNEKSYKRKLIEFMVAPKIEQKYSKADIMEFYVNTCFYGNGCYGIESASQYYFGKHNTDLTLAEAAMLCGVSNAPSEYNPEDHFDKATQKKEQVLKNMLNEGYITKDEYTLALGQPINLILDDGNDTVSENYMMSYAIRSTAIQMMKDEGFTFQYVFNSKQGEEDYNESFTKALAEKTDLIRAGGYKIYTSFDTDLQSKLQEAIDSNLEGYTELQDNGKYAMQGAAVCIDNTTGYVVAMVGGRGEDDIFNRAYLAERQPGSTIKPLLVYAPSINEGVVNPSTLYTDKEIHYTTPDGKDYSPMNSGGGYRGNVKIREALARSINTVACQLYQNTKPSIALEYLENMKFSSLSYQDVDVMSLCLGGFTNGTRVVDMARGYATIAMGGQYSDRTCIVKVEHEKQGVIYEDKTKKGNLTEVFTADTAFMIQDMMQGTLEESYGTATSIRNRNMIVAGKTGTTNSNKDAWFCGFTKYYTCAVWMGYDTPREMYGMYGGRVPARIFSDFMSGIDKNLEYADFDKPDTVTLRRVDYKGNYSDEDIDVSYSDGDRWYSKRSYGQEWYSYLNEDKYKAKQEEILSDTP